MLNIIKNVFIACLGIFSVQSFNILRYHNVTTSEIDFYFCDDISPILEEVTREVIEEINTYELFKIKLNKETRIEHTFNNKNSICNDNLNNHYISEYGFCTHYLPFYNETDISISNTLLGIDTNLYNVVLHEVLHALGLDHTNTKGMMNYTVKLSINKGIIKDNSKLYISVDDYDGLTYLYDKLQNDVERNEDECDKNVVINFINNCV